MMYRCNSEDCAARVAKDNGLLYGLSVFGGWFVGSPAELSRIGVADIKHPESCVCHSCVFSMTREVVTL